MIKRIKKVIPFFVLFIVLVQFQSCTGRSVQEPLELRDIISTLDKYFDEEIGNTIPGAVILFIKDGEVYYKNAFGYKDLESRTRMTTDTVFRVASVSKTVAALRVMRLVEDGTISLDELVDNYLTRQRFTPSMHDIGGLTFRRLLSHTAGTRPHFYYQDLNYNVLQLEITLRNRTFLAEYVSENIFEPLNMTSSFYDVNLIPPERLATSYNNELGFPPRFFLSSAWDAAGGLYTTAGDLANLIIGMIRTYRGEENNFVVTRDTLVSMLTPHGHSLMIDGLSTGLGFFIMERDNGIVTYSHGGILPGWRAHYEFSLDTGDGIIILTNGDNGGINVIQPLLNKWIQSLL
ncbi:MAG: beta-lactamase family protein [Treponema sp.]|jgi:CubicO group peptidase (beta-lactamase class C family)|nr:beta-lactamase family protein [Treponema sp.]